MPLADVIGDGGRLERQEDRPWQPRDGGCICCRQPLRPHAAPFCARCAEHPLGAWCVAMVRTRWVWSAEARRYEEVKRYATTRTRYPAGGVLAGHKADTATAQEQRQHVRNS